MTHPVLLVQFDDGSGFSVELFRARLALVPEEAWDNATPCPDWTVHDVAVHVINGFRLVPALLTQEPVDPADRNRDTLGANLTEAGHVALEAAVAALRRPGALDAEVNAPAGVMPARMFALISENVGCCAFAGDRGMLHPELTASATRAEASDVAAMGATAHASCIRTCELGMTRATGQPYRHVLELPAELTTPHVNLSVAPFIKTHRSP